MASTRGLPTFTETPNTELNTLLATMRTKVFLPAHLNREQLDLIYKPVHIPRLSNPTEPVYASIGGEDIPLEHINRVRDLPRTWPIFNSALCAAQSKQDWANIVTMLEGFKSSKRKLKSAWLQKFVRRANMAGRQAVVLQALQRVEHTGLSLGDQGVLETVLAGVVDMAVVHKWGEEHTKKALSYAEQVAAWMEQPEHCGRAWVGKSDPRASPAVIGVLVELSAVLATKFEERLDDDGKVKMYTERLLAAIEQQGGAEKAIPPAPENAKEAPGYIRKWIPVWHGLKLVHDITGHDTQEIVRLLEERIDAAADVVRTQRPEGENNGAIKFWNELRQ
ncbi:hypothetical protein H2201_005219 [Coniosporium apollinis]|uniref:Uncharacterized protein n=1 Tax=Coniosporium apollinis TaxID=61459 RepID=A0ABQ9NS23_9PEZI|nr:hypothetical protein H2201_005219 [Coniosporium apollinis]